MSRSILVVEDNGPIRDLLREVLESEGYEVETAASGIEALAKLDRKVPALVITDVLMPLMDGFTFIRELERRGLRSGVSILVLPANPRYRPEAEALKVDGFLSKPFHIPELLGEVARLLPEAASPGETPDAAEPLSDKQL